MALQRRSDWCVISVSVDDDFGVLQIPQLWNDVAYKFRLTGLAELEAALREQHVAGFDEFLLRPRLGQLCLELLVLTLQLIVGALRYASSQHKRG